MAKKFQSLYKVPYQVLVAKTLKPLCTVCVQTILTNFTLRISMFFPAVFPSILNDFLSASKGLMGFGGIPMILKRMILCFTIKDIKILILLSPLNSHTPLPFKSFFFTQFHTLYFCF